MEAQQSSRARKSLLNKESVVAANTRHKGKVLEKHKRKIKQSVKDMAILGLAKLLSNLHKKGTRIHLRFIRKISARTKCR